MAISRGNWLAGTREMGPTSRSNSSVTWSSSRRVVTRPTRPPETVGTIGEFLQNVAAVVLSPVLDLDALRRPGARL